MVKPLLLENKISSVLHLLFSGQPWETKSNRYFLGENYDLCIELKKYKDYPNGIPEIIYSGLDILLKDFIKSIEDTPDEEIYLLNANKALRDINKRGWTDDKNNNSR